MSPSKAVSKTKVVLKRSRKLYGILYTIIDQLYGQNLGYGDDQPVSNIITNLFAIEGALIDWKSMLPKGLDIIQPDEVALRLAQDEPASPSHLALKLQMVLTMRYLNVRLLLHRAVLLRILGSNGAAVSVNHEAVLLQHVSPNSTKTCLDSAVHTLDLVHATVTSPGSHKEVLGAWWFSLYYSKIFPYGRRDLFVLDDHNVKRQPSMRRLLSSPAFSAIRSCQPVRNGRL